MKKGVTLVEMVIAVMVLGIVLAGILMVFINCMFLNDANRNTGRAIGHAQYVMEDMRDFVEANDIDALFNNVTNNNWDWNVAAIQAEGLGVLDNENIDSTAGWENPPDNNLANITVTVNWQDRRARARSIFLRTLFTDL